MSAPVQPDDLSSYLPADAAARHRLSRTLQRSAKLIAGADILFLHTGAGFSADSGLPVYDQISDHPALKSRNLSYRDLCNPLLLTTEPLLFLGFWGSCFNQYRDVRPHSGYDRIREWKESKFHGETRVAKLIREEMRIILREKIAQSHTRADTDSGSECKDSSTVTLEVERATKRTKTDSEISGNDNSVVDEVIEIVHAQSTLHIHRDTATEADADSKAFDASFTSTIREVQQRRLSQSNTSASTDADTGDRVSISHSHRTHKPQPQPPRSSLSFCYSILNNTDTGSDSVYQSLIPDALGSFYSFTSNVDHHFIKAGFSASELYEIHGNSESWQCSDLCTFDTWAPNSSFRFDVDDERMAVRVKTRTQAFIDAYHSDSDSDSGDDSAVSHYWTPSSSFLTHRPVCPFGHPARPRILMFNDQSFIHDSASEERYLLYLHAVLNLTDRDPSLSVAVVEIGAGTNIPTVRQRSEALYTMIKHSAGASAGGCSGGMGHRSLIRVNPSDSVIEGASGSGDSDGVNACVSVPLNGLLFIEIVDRLVKQQHQAASSSSPCPAHTVP